MWCGSTWSSRASRPLTILLLHFAGLSAPALIRSLGFFTHITLHHIMEHVDFAAAGVRKAGCSSSAPIWRRALCSKQTPCLVLLPGYQRTLMSKYAAKNVLLGTHGTFAAAPTPPDFTKRGNPDMRILAIGHWGTYKRLETLMEAFPKVLEKVPNARLIIAGANHHTRAGYWESIRAAQPAHLPIEFLGYVPEEDIPDLYQSTSLLVMPYDSATGSSGPAHQACEYGIPIVSADIPDLREMAVDEDMAVSFYQTANANDLAEQMVSILSSPELQRRMAEQNYRAGVRMTMGSVIRTYLRWFELQRSKNALRNGVAVATNGRHPVPCPEAEPPFNDPPSSGLSLEDEYGFAGHRAIEFPEETLRAFDSVQPDRKNPDALEESSSIHPCSPSPSFEGEC